MGVVKIQPNDCESQSVTEIGHMFGYFHRCQNATFSFSLWNVLLWHRWLERDLSLSQSLSCILATPCILKLDRMLQLNLQVMMEQLQGPATSCKPTAGIVPVIPFRKIDSDIFWKLYFLTKFGCFIR